MFGWMIICMSVSNIKLTNATREALHKAGVDMIRTGRDQSTFQIDSFEGIIRKEQDFVPFMDNGGPSFSAEVETEYGKGRVYYIIPSRYLEALDNKDIQFVGSPMHMDLNPQRAAKASLN